jgi:hypothetical protein
MKISDARALTMCAGMVAFAGCAGGSATAPGLTQPAQVAAPSGFHFTALHGVPLERRDHAHSWMDRAAKSMSLLYISDYNTDDVYVVSYPKGKLVGTLTGFDHPQGECVDASNDVWITNTNASEIVEYAHGGTNPIATLIDSGQYPVGCSIDPTTGNLAATSIFSTKDGQGNVAIYASAAGNPTTYTAPLILYYYFCGYDNAGDLYVDGTVGGYHVPDEVAVLPKSESKFYDVALDQSMYFPGDIKWDGKYMAIGDQSDALIYQFDIKGSDGLEVGSTPLANSGDVVGYWIDGKTVIGADAADNDAAYWKYPKGGKPTKIINHIPSSFPEGAAVSNP